MIKQLSKKEKEFYLNPNLDSLNRPVKHSIISWDCSYRNFFNLIDGLLNQEYSKDQFELIYVEQRSLEIANKYNKSLGLKTLEDRYEEVRSKINFKIIYLNDSADIPYNLGRSNNAGLYEAGGEIISVMDGDQLLPKDFLQKLDHYHKKNPSAVVNVQRRMCDYPVGVKSYSDWKEGVISFEPCLLNSRGRYNFIYKHLSNKGPLISARRKFWEKIHGYDTSFLWSTAFSKLGKDTTERLEIASGSRSTALPNTFTVHPWHPKGEGVLRKENAIEKFFSHQDKLIHWSVENKDPDWRNRLSYTEHVYSSNKEFIDEVINAGLHQTMRLEIPQKSIFLQKNKTSLSQIKNLIKHFVFFNKKGR